MTALQTVRTTLFYLLLALSALLWCSLSFFVAPLLPYRLRYHWVVRSWCAFAVWLCKVLVGIDYRISGLEQVPAGPFVVLAKHQSTWETFLLSALFSPLTQVLKRELLYIPFFGWAIAMVRPIAIDRSQPKQALKQVARQGAERLASGSSILIFPEGTRLPPGQIGKFSRGGAALAANAGVPVIPVALNSGEFWPKQGWAKYPGTIEVRIGPAMYAEGQGSRAIAELNERAYAWVCQAQQQIAGAPLSCAEGVPEGCE